MKDSDIADAISKWVIVTMTTLLAVAIGACVWAAFHQKHPTQFEIDERKETAGKLAYCLSHPEIVGTNDLGEVIIRYTIPISRWQTHYVYELNGTKTTIIPPVRKCDTQKVIIEKQ